MGLGLLEMLLLTEDPIGMCGPRQDSCLFGHCGVDPACTHGSPSVFGAFFTLTTVTKTDTDLLPVLGTSAS